MKRQNTITVLTIIETLLITVREQYWSNHVSDFKASLQNKKMTDKQYEQWKETFWGETGFLEFKMTKKEHLIKDTEEANRILNNLKYDLYRSWSREISPSFKNSKKTKRKEVQKCLV